jgi:hypothetical protein
MENVRRGKVGAWLESYGPSGHARRCGCCECWIWGNHNCWTVRGFLGMFRAWVCEACVGAAEREGAL